MAWGWWWPPVASPSLSDGEASPSPTADSLVEYDAASTPYADALERGTFSTDTPSQTPTPALAQASEAVAGRGEGEWCGFVDTYGRFTGPGLVAGVLTALLWTLLLIAINLKPTWAINRLFGTQEIDDGDFWLFSSRDGANAACIVAGLIMVALYYLYLLFLLGWRRKHVKTVDDYVAPMTSSCSTFLCDFVRVQFNALDVESRPYLKVSEEVPEIAYQTLLLGVFMESGVSSVLVVVFSTVIACNCFVRCYRVLASGTYHERNDSLTNMVFQFFFAVVFPIVQLVVAAAAFAMDSESYLLRVARFETGSIERLARFAQPDGFLRSHTISRPLVELLILSSHTSLAVAILGIHVALLWRCHDIILGCLLGYKAQRIPITAEATDSFILSFLRLVKAAYSLTIKLLLACLCVSKSFVPKVFAWLLFSYGVGIIVVTSVGLVHSERACEPFAGRCVLQAITFQGFSSEKYSMCLCIVYVNQPLTTTTTNSPQWTIHQDVTDDVRAVAASGRLQVIQIVDRDLVAVPDVVSDCTHLRELVLVRTALKALPPWLVDLEELQLLYLTGDPNATIESFPLESEFFQHKPQLRSLRLENLTRLSRVPSFPESALPSLRSVVLKDLPMVRSLPLMGQLDSVRILVLSQMATLQRLPLLPSRLDTLRVEMPTALCCNGYLEDFCGGVTTASNVTTQCQAHDAAMNATTLCLVSDTVSTTQTVATQRWLHESQFQCASTTTARTTPVAPP